jgi:hypothetical protein
MRPAAPNQGVSCTNDDFIDQRCVADEHDRQLVIDHVYVIDGPLPLISITESSLLTVWK